MFDRQMKTERGKYYRRFSTESKFSSTMSVLSVPGFLLA